MFQPELIRVLKQENWCEPNSIRAPDVFNAGELSRPSRRTIMKPTVLDNPNSEKTPMQLKDQVALVTGASLGIGRATAIALAQAGARVAINYRSHPEEAEQVAEAVREAGSEALVLKADVADRQAVEQLVADTVAKFERLDIAVSNAAYSARELFYDANMEEFERTVNVTMWGAFYLTRAAARQMISQGGGGSIAIVSSPHAYVAIPESMAYNISKAAIDQMARTAAIELAEHRIRVNTIVPGWIDTPGERRMFSDEEFQRGGAKIPLGRLGRPDEIARGVVFVCDPKNEYMTGSSLLIDGGITLPWWSSHGGAIPE